MLGFDGTALWWDKAKARDRGPGREMCPCVLGTPFPLAAQHRSAEEAPGTLSTANRWVSDIRSADPWALYSSISLGSLATEKVTISWRHPATCSGPLFPTMKSLHFRSPGCYTLLTILGCYSQLEKAVSQILNSKTEKNKSCLTEILASELNRFWNMYCNLSCILMVAIPTSFLLVKHFFLQSPGPWFISA